ncbi:hypothetical protein BDN67DRAFT_963468 [Paxillus ammoniavirescens]|nr:hypothetical protein BDN67DRAFT_963468 [Paxillus ammoniavirescens]
MAPLSKYLAFFSLALSVSALASPHISRNVYNHAHRGLGHAKVDADIPVPVAAPPKRKRSLNKRCVPKPANATTSALPTSSPLPASSPLPTSVPVLPSAAPVNVAPAPASPPPSSSSPAESPSTPPPPPPPPTSTAPPPAQTSPPPSNSGEPSFMIGTQDGQGTYYATGLGACGITNTDTEYIAAVSYLLFDAYPGYNGVNPNDNPVCNQKVTASYQGKSIQVTITDRCTGCAITDLDFSPSAFNSLADPSLGRIDISWVWSP